MAYVEIGMWEVLEVLRRVHRGESQAAIERVTGRTRETVRRYARLARKLGWDPKGPEPDEALARAVLERHRHSSTVVTSNRTIDEWIALFDDPILAQSALDRLAHNAYPLVIEGESFRKRQRPGAERTAKPLARNRPKRGPKRRTPQETESCYDNPTAKGPGSCS